MEEGFFAVPEIVFPFPLQIAALISRSYVIGWRLLGQGPTMLRPKPPSSGPSIFGYDRIRAPKRYRCQVSKSGIGHSYSSVALKLTNDKRVSLSPLPFQQHFCHS